MHRRPNPLFTTPTPPPGLPPSFPPGSAISTNDAVLNQLAASISHQSDEAAAHNVLLSHQLEHNLEKEEKKKDRFKKLHASTKQLILFASAEDATDIPTEVIKSCTHFINAESVGNAKQELNLQFKNLVSKTQPSHLASPKPHIRENTFGLTKVPQATFPRFPSSR